MARPGSILHSRWDPHQHFGDADPLKDIAAIHNVSRVIKGDKTYDPAAIERALGIVPRSRKQTAPTATDAANPFGVAPIPEPSSVVRARR